MTTFDAHLNFAYGTVATAPSPATSGTSLVLTSGHGARFPTPPFNAVIWVAGASALSSNAEVVRVTAKSTDTLTITRAQEGSSARTVVVGDQIAAAITSKTLTDVETALNNLAAAATYTTLVGDGSATSFVLTHNLNTRDIFIQARDAASPYTLAEVGVEATSTTTCTVYFASAPATNSVSVSITPGGGGPPSDAWSSVSLTSLVKGVTAGTYISLGTGGTATLRYQKIGRTVNGNLIIVFGSDHANDIPYIKSADLPAAIRPRTTANTSAAGFAYINAVETSGGADNGMVAPLGGVISMLGADQVLIWSHIIATDTSDGVLGTIWNTAGIPYNLTSRAFFLYWAFTYESET